MQPLSYQVLPTSCWVTSVINGLLVIYRDKDRIPGVVYRLLHSVLTDEGVHNCGPTRNDWRIVLEAVRVRTGLSMHIYEDEKVARAVSKLHFQNQVAVCDVEAGGHSILLTGRADGWLEAFDPDWNSVKKRPSKADAYTTFPEVPARRQGLVNLHVNPRYFVRSGAGRTGKFQMGAVDERTLIVMEKT